MQKYADKEQQGHWKTYTAYSMSTKKNTKTTSTGTILRFSLLTLGNYVNYCQL